jgi:hypothetical protein
MTTPQNSSTPAGWYPDPAGTGGTRWWNGVTWTDDTHTAYVEAHVRQAVPPASAGTPAYNVHIWTIIALLVVSTLSVFLVNVEAQLLAGVQEGATGVPAPIDAGTVINQILSFVIWGLSALFAFFDWREIKRSGVQQPFHWAWSFLSILVYLIGRGIIMQRRTGAGIATMWIAIAYFVFTFVYVIVIFVAAFSILMNEVSLAP